MFGALGAFLFGAVVTGAWIEEDKYENNRRKNAKEKNIPFYYDKNGIMRHADTRRKYTTEEVHILFHGNKEEKKKERAEQYKKEFERKYYAVLNPYKHFEQEVFLTYKEAKEYICDCKKEGEKIKDEPWVISKAHIKKGYFKFNLHFKESDGE